MCIGVYNIVRIETVSLHKHLVCGIENPQPSSGLERAVIKNLQPSSGFGQPSKPRSFFFPILFRLLSPTNHIFPPFLLMCILSFAPLLLIIALHACKCSYSILLCFVVSGLLILPESLVERKNHGKYHKHKHTSLIIVL